MRTVGEELTLQSSVRRNVATKTIVTKSRLRPSWSRRARGTRSGDRWCRKERAHVCRGTITQQGSPTPEAGLEADAKRCQRVEMNALVEAPVAFG